jgi:hypothetical protein
MRPELFVTLLTFAALAIVPIASAEDKKDIKENNRSIKYDSQREVVTTGPVDAPYGGLTPKEHYAIPYQPCLHAVGWENGKLRCNND